MAGSLETSPGTKVALPPISLVVRSPASTSMSLTTTAAPSDANSSAISRPRPDPLPVTSATLFPSLPGTESSYWHRPAFRVAVGLERRRAGRRSHPGRYAPSGGKPARAEVHVRKAGIVGMPGIRVAVGVGNGDGPVGLIGMDIDVIVVIAIAVGGCDGAFWDDRRAVRAPRRPWARVHGPVSNDFSLCSSQ